MEILLSAQYEFVAKQETEKVLGKAVKGIWATAAFAGLEEVADFTCLNKEDILMQASAILADQSLL